jgi:hypothetical protein
MCASRTSRIRCSHFASALLADGKLSHSPSETSLQVGKYDTECGHKHYRRCTRPFLLQLVMLRRNQNRHKTTYMKIERKGIWNFSADACFVRDVRGAGRY